MSAVSLHNQLHKELIKRTSFIKMDCDQLSLVAALSRRQCQWHVGKTVDHALLGTEQLQDFVAICGGANILAGYFSSMKFVF